MPPEIIVAIIGVETRYGRNAGSYRVLDALSTLAFDYPPRSDFFRGELTEFLLLAREEGMDPRSLTGSYAGAMGYGQFIPSSFRNYAVDFDGDGKRNIWTNPKDAIGSVANYFRKHGWTADGRVVESASVSTPQADAVSNESLNLLYTVGQLRALGRDGERRSGCSRGRAVPNGWQRRARVLGRLAQLLCDHPVQPQQHVRARRSSTGSCHREPRNGSSAG